LKFFQQTLIENFQARFDLEFSSVIVIAIEKLIRIDRTLIKDCRDESVFICGGGTQKLKRSRGFAPPLWHPQLR